MGQKVNPHGLRVGLITNWDSQWYDEYNEYRDYVIKNHYKISKKVCSFNHSAVRQFMRSIMQKIAKRWLLFRKRL